MRLNMEEAGPDVMLAKSICGKCTKLSGHGLKKIEKRIAAFEHAYLLLDQHLKRPTDISVKIDGPEIRNLWHSYLITGRELFDDVGSVTHICFGMSEKVSGLNEKKFGSWFKNIEKAKPKVSGLDQLEKHLKKHQEVIVQFIDLRNRDKERGDTLVEPPYINPDGNPSDGRISSHSHSSELNMVDFIKESHEEIIDFVSGILCPQSLQS